MSTSVVQKSLSQLARNMRTKVLLDVLVLTCLAATDQNRYAKLQSTHRSNVLAAETSHFRSENACNSQNPTE